MNFVDDAVGSGRNVTPGSRVVQEGLERTAAARLDEAADVVDTGTDVLAREPRPTGCRRFVLGAAAVVAAAPCGDAPCTQA